MIALALPLREFARSSAARPGRAIIFITFVVILVTLVLQGLTLAPLIRLLGIVGGSEEDLEEREARRASIRAGAEALERIAAERGAEAEAASVLRSMAAHQLSRLANPPSPPAGHWHLRLTMIAAEREAVISMRDRNEISDSVMRRLQREFDHEEVLLRQRHR